MLCLWAPQLASVAPRSEHTHDRRRETVLVWRCVWGSVCSVVLREPDLEHSCRLLVQVNGFGQIQRLDQPANDRFRVRGTPHRCRRVCRSASMNTHFPARSRAMAAVSGVPFSTYIMLAFSMYSIASGNLCMSCTAQHTHTHTFSCHVSFTLNNVYTRVQRG